MKNFLFHRVHPIRDKLWDPMDPELFRKCIAYITRNYRVVSLEEYILSPEFQKKPLDNRLATILFDDGYKDNIEYAVPILQEFNCPASFYIVTECIEKNTLTWTHKLEYLFQTTQKNEISFNIDLLPPEFRINRLSAPDQRLAYVRKLKPYLKTIPHELREVILNQIYEILGNQALPELMMTWKDVKELHDAGYQIGSHTVTHAMLGTMADPNEIRRELKDSADAIQKITGTFPRTISYPVGSYNKETIRLSREAGYQVGLAVKQQIYRPGKDDLFEIPRIELYNEPWIKTKMRITHRLEQLKSLIRYKN